MQTVSQLDKYNPDIIVESKDDALEVLGLEIASVSVHGRLDLGQSVHQGGYLLAEKPLDVVHGIVRILHHVVQKGGYDRLVAQAYLVHHDLGHGYGMDNIRFP